MRDLSESVAVFQYKDRKVHILRDEFVKVSGWLPLIAGSNSYIHLLWEDFDKNNLVARRFFVSESEFLQFENVLRIRRNIGNINPEIPHNRAIYTADGIMKYQLPIDNPYLHFGGKTFRVDYIQMDRYQLIEV